MRVCAMELLVIDDDKTYDVCVSLPGDTFRLCFLVKVH